MTMKRKVDVSLLGHRFTVRTERDEAWVHSLAAHLSRRIDEARRQMRSASREEQILFVALNLADELAEEIERSSSARAEVRRHTEQMIAKLSTALAADGSGGQVIEDESDEVAVAVVRSTL